MWLKYTLVISVATFHEWRLLHAWERTTNGLVEGVEYVETGSIFTTYEMFVMVSGYAYSFVNSIELNFDKSKWYRLLVSYVSFQL